ncbi:CRISPR-associated endoribonuclease Cas6 [Ureibacillus terrenus]|uniref:CRISPR-associated endoribonuclease Cas6 n=1 Tax=Ureibacillus terrenus TaxID=118246 RepID=A0A540V4R1_9BACL|nr:CRISPR-associated endoribonuclease Cas6 [Ureibacillus terrenus]MED3660529.1 CRISPR-associated endoribonuclease Cas6 [Ureibacillus terrenus]TQE91730.1 CRISPR-associated endoribonuclease Cas6 [Ureibacillus terrenus]
MKIQAILEGDRMPRHYHFAMASLVKSALSVSNPKLADALYKFSGNRANKKIKPFTGFIQLKDYELLEEEFIVRGNVYITISSPDPELLLNIYNGMVQQREFHYKQYRFQVLHVKVLPEKLPKTGKALCQTKSPIVIRNREGEFLDIDDPDYLKELNYISNECVKQLEGRSLYSPIKLTPVLMTKKVVQLKHDAFKNLNPHSILYLNAYVGSFILEGDPRDLRLLVQAGLGFRRSEFLGCIELIHE